MTPSYTTEQEREALDAWRAWFKVLIEYHRLVRDHITPESE